jgi:hypothetical protein
MRFFILVKPKLLNPSLRLIKNKILIQMKKIDLFKVFIILIGISFLYLFHDYRKNGRYQVLVEQGINTIIDTRTGELFLVVYPEANGNGLIKSFKNKGEVVPYIGPIQAQ